MFTFSNSCPAEKGTSTTVLPCYFHFYNVGVLAALAPHATRKIHIRQATILFYFFAYYIGIRLLHTVYKWNLSSTCPSQFRSECVSVNTQYNSLIVSYMRISMFICNYLRTVLTTYLCRCSLLILASDERFRNTCIITEKCPIGEPFLSDDGVIHKKCSSNTSISSGQ